MNLLNLSHAAADDNLLPRGSDKSPSPSNQDDSTATLTFNALKPKKPLKRKVSDADLSPDPKSSGPARGYRGKNFRKPNEQASKRGSQGAKAMGKRVIENFNITEKIVEMSVPDDDLHEEVVFIDNHTQLPVLSLYRSTEAAEPMSHLFKDFISETQTIRDHIGPEQLGSFLHPAELEAIQLKNNYRIFPELVTSKGYLRSKNNTDASGKASRAEGVFAKKYETATVSGITAEDLFHRAKALKMKAAAFTAQAEAYASAAKTLEADEKLSKTVEATVTKDPEELGMFYLGQELPLNRKELHNHMQAHEAHLIAVAEKLRGEMSSVAAFAHRAEQSLRDQIQTKKHEKFEVQSWQMGALPTGSHVCECSADVLLQIVLQLRNTSSKMRM